MAKERIALWDNLKLILIAMVVAGHFADFFTGESPVCRGIFLFIYAFHMPLFFFVSGLFHSDEKVTQRCLFYFSGGVLLRVFLATFSRLYGNPTPSFPLFHEDGVPWFLYALAAYTFIAWVVRKQNFLYLIPAAVVLGCFVGYDKTIGDTLCLSRIIVFAPAYLAGVAIDPGELAAWKKRNIWLAVPSILMLAGWAALCYFKTAQIYGLRNLFTGRHPFTATVAPWGPLVRLACYVLAFFLSGALIILTPSFKIPFVTKMGQNTLNVFFWHWPVYMTLEKFFHIKSIYATGVKGKALFMLLSVAVTVVLAAVPVFKFPLKQLRTSIFREHARPAPADDAPDDAASPGPLVLSVPEAAAPENAGAEAAESGETEPEPAAPEAQAEPATAE